MKKHEKQGRWGNWRRTIRNMILTGVDRVRRPPVRFRVYKGDMIVAVENNHGLSPQNLMRALFEEQMHSESTYVICKEGFPWMLKRERVNQRVALCKSLMASSKVKKKKRRINILFSLYKLSVGVARFRRLFDSICGISQRRVGVKEEQRIFGIDSLR